jgi:hypothetical protein
MQLVVKYWIITAENLRRDENTEERMIHDENSTLQRAPIAKLCLLLAESDAILMIPVVSGEISKRMHTKKADRHCHESDRKSEQRRDMGKFDNSNAMRVCFNNSKPGKQKLKRYRN